MANHAAGTILRHLGQWAGPQVGPNVPDAQLVERFVTRREESAFAALLRRHGRLVWGVCQHILPREQDAEDAFQATFLVLARRAGSIRKGASVASWLYGVAYRVAVKAKRTAARRRERERQAAAPAPAPADLSWRELQAVLDEELARLPEKYRAPFVLCCLEGRGRKEAAAELGWRAGTVSSRVAQARRLLQARLARRGVTLSAALCAAALWRQSAAAAVPAALVQGILAALTGPAGAARPAAAGLAAAVIRGTDLLRARAAALVLAAGVLAAGGALLTGRGGAEKGQTPAEPAAAARPGPRAAGKGVRGDAFGDPLPEGALARVGTLRLRHGNVVWALAFAPDGKAVASAGVDGFAHVWDPATGKERLRIEDDAFRDSGIGLGAFRDLAYAPDGKTLAGARLNRPACLWDAATGKELRTFGGDCLAAWVRFSPDGKTLAYGGERNPRNDQDAVIHLADPATGKDLRHLEGHKGPVVHVAFAPSGKTLASAGGDKTVRLWDVAAGREVGRFPTDGQGATRLAFSPDGKSLAGCGREGKWLRLWEVASRKEVRAVRLTGPRDEFCGVLFAADGKTLVTGHGDGSVRFWDAASGRPVRRFAAHPGMVSALALSPDSKVLASSANVHTTGEFAVRLWDAATGKPLVEHAGPQQGIAGVTFSPDGKLVALGSWEGAVHVADAASGRVRLRIGVFGLPAFAPDGKTLITGSGWPNGQVRFWDLATISSAATAPAGPPAAGRELRRFPAHAQGIGTLALSADGKTLVTGGGDDEMRLWDLAFISGAATPQAGPPAAGREIHAFGGKVGFVLRLALTPEGKTLASAHYDHTVRLWDVASGRLLRRVAQTRNQPGCLALSSDGKVLAWSDGEQSVHLTDVATGKELRRLEGEGSRPDALDGLALSPDGKALAWGGQHVREVYLWETATGRLRRKLAGHHGQITSIAFAPDGTRLASGSADATVLVWDAVGRRQPAAGRLTDQELEGLWAELAGDDAAAAYRAMGALAGSPRQAVALFRRHLKPVAAADPGRLAELVRRLDSDTFAVREKAREELEELGEAAEPALRQALAGAPTVETRRRVEGLLERLGGTEPLRRGRALEVLEWLGDDEAGGLLRALAGGAAGAARTREARAALGRLAGRGRAP
jgi:RNA polymerase sigma factor (sigma-70 family)